MHEPDLDGSARLEHLPKKLVDIYLWYSLAALRGVDNAEPMANALKQRLSSDELRFATHELSTRCPGSSQT